MADPAAAKPTAIYAVLDKERRERGLSWRQLASEAGVNASSLSRMAQGQAPALEGLVKLADWSNMTVDELIGRSSESFDGDVPAMAAISSYLRSRKELSERSVAHLEEIIEAAYNALRDDAAPRE